VALRADLSQLIVFLLVFCRVGGVLALAPVIGSQRVPVRIKAALALAISLALAPCAGPAPACRDAITIALAAGGEVALGLAIGFGARLIFSAIQIAGEMADAQSAFGFAGIVAPDTGERNSVIGQLQTAVASLIFLAADGHHYRAHFQIVALGFFISQADLKIARIAADVGHLRLHIKVNQWIVVNLLQNVLQQNLGVSPFQGAIDVSQIAAQLGGLLH